MYMNIQNVHGMLITYITYITENIGISKHEKHDFFVQVRKFLLPLSLMVLRHKEREAQSFYSGFFICSPPISCDTCPRPPRASESQPSSPEAVLNSTNWLFQNLPKSSAHFRCLTSPALCNPVSCLGYCDISEWHVHSTRARVSTCVGVAPK